MNKKKVKIFYKNIIYLTLLIIMSGSNLLSDLKMATPFIHNYSQKEHGLHPQNWAAVQDNRGVMYFGNSGGLLEFDGKNWKKIKVKQNLIISALGKDSKGVIYYGSVGEFGYLASNSDGELQCVSLTNKLNSYEKDFNIIKKVLATSTGIYFFTQKKIFCYHDNKISIIKEPLLAMFGFSVFDKIYAIFKNKGIAIIKGDKYQILPNSKEIIKNSGRIIMLPYLNNKILIATNNKGFFIYDLKTTNKKQRNGSITGSYIKFKTALDAFIKTNQLYSGEKIHNNHFAFGTIHGGMAIIDYKGKLISIMNKQRGLQNDIVLNLYEDSFKNLWLCLNEGISYVEINSPIRTFNKYNNINYILATIEHKGITYAGQMNGISYLPPYKLQINNDRHNFIPLDNIRENCFNFFVIGENLYGTDIEKIIQLDGQNTTSVFDFDSSRAIYSTGFSNILPNYVFFGMVNGLSAVKFSYPDNSSKPIFLEEFLFKELKHSNIRKITPDKKGGLWLSSESHGIIHLSFPSNKLHEYKLVFFDTSNGLPSMVLNRVHNLFNKTYVATSKGIYRLNFNQGEKISKKNVKFAPDLKYQKLFPDPIGDIIVKLNKQNYLISYANNFKILTQNKDQTLSLDTTSITRIRSLLENAYYSKGKYLLLSGSAGIFVYDLEKKRTNIHYNTLIRRISVNDSYIFNGTYYNNKYKTNNLFSVSSLTQSDNIKKILPYSDNSILFEFSAAFYTLPKATMFQSKLHGFDKKWTRYSNKKFKEYTNLPEGKYTFQVRAKNLYEQTGNIAEYKFSILPPWHRTILATLIKILLIILILFLFIWFNSKRLIYAKKKLEKIIEERTLEIKSQRNQLKKANDRLEEIANIDSLTEIPNRRSFDNNISIEWKRCYREKTPISFIMIDVDRFKQYNDIYGHQKGDLCLKKLGAVLSHTLNRPGDLAARYGGEEFAVILSNTSKEGSLLVAEEIRERVASLKIEHKGNNSKDGKIVTISLGVKTMIPDNNENYSKLIKSADAALYSAKESGRNKVIYA